MKTPAKIPLNYDSLKEAYVTAIEEVNNLQATNNDLQFRNAKLEHELLWFKKQIFGQKSERFIPAQEAQTAFDFAAQADETTVSTQEVAAHQRSVVSEPAKKGHGRIALPADLPRNEIVIEPTEDVSEMNKIGEEISETLEYNPGNFYVNRYIRPKYAKADGSGTVITALPATRPIDKGIPGASLLAHVLLSKFVDHLPLYRISNILERDGVKISPSTLAGWVEGSYNLLLNIYHRLEKEVFDSDYLQVDETTIKVQDERCKGKTHLGYFWVYRNPIKRLLFFDYRESRASDSPTEMLAGFKGYLQTDGYGGYGEVQRRDDIISVACMAHARRKFIEAEEKGSPKAKVALELIGKLYTVEAEAREKSLDATARKLLREEHAVPVLNDFKSWLNKEILTALPKSQLGLAIVYSLNRIESLQTYVKDGRLEIDNNLVENAIRPVAVGRKNWLFAGSHDGADRAALIYSLVGTCKEQGLEPREYLTRLLSEAPDCKNVIDLLPIKKNPT